MAGLLSKPLTGYEAHRAKIRSAGGSGGITIGGPAYAPKQQAAAPSPAPYAAPRPAPFQAPAMAGGFAGGGGLAAPEKDASATAMLGLQMAGPQQEPTAPGWLGSIPGSINPNLGRRVPPNAISMLRALTY